MKNKKSKIRNKIYVIGGSFLVVTMLITFIAIRCIQNKEIFNFNISSEQTDYMVSTTADSSSKDIVLDMGLRMELWWRFCRILWITKRQIPITSMLHNITIYILG